MGGAQAGAPDEVTLQAVMRDVPAYAPAMGAPRAVPRPQPEAGTQEVVLEEPWEDFCLIGDFMENFPDQFLVVTKSEPPGRYPDRTSWQQPFLLECGRQFPVQLAQVAAGRVAQKASTEEVDW